MGKINGGRVILGGVVAGIVINVFEWILNGVILRDQWQRVMKTLGRPEAYSAGVMAVYICWAFLVGILNVWLYAAVRPRFGAGPRTAVTTGLAAWVFVYVQAMVVTANMGLLPTRLILVGVVVGLFEMVLASVAGAWLYKEQSEIPS